MPFVWSLGLHPSSTSGCIPLHYLLPFASQQLGAVARLKHVGLSDCTAGSRALLSFCRPGTIVCELRQQTKAGFTSVKQAAPVQMVV